MYQLQYWNEGAAEWRGAGYHSTQLDLCKRRMRAASQECGGCVRFRINEVTRLTPSLAD